MHFITNGFKRFSKTNSSDPRQRVLLSNGLALIRELDFQMCWSLFKLDTSCPTSKLDLFVHQTDEHKTFQITPN